METVEEYLVRMHQAVGDNYRRDDRSPHSCSAIAQEIARRLVREGKRPYLVGFQGEPIKEGWQSSEFLKPLRFNGDVKWSGHIVCCAGTDAYDPIIGLTVPVTECAKVLFGHNARMQVIANEESTLDMVLD